MDYPSVWLWTVLDRDRFGWIWENVRLFWRLFRLEGSKSLNEKWPTCFPWVWQKNNNQNHFDQFLQQRNWSLSSFLTSLQRFILRQAKKGYKCFLHLVEDMPKNTILFDYVQPVLTFQDQMKCNFSSYLWENLFWTCRLCRFMEEIVRELALLSPINLVTFPRTWSHFLASKRLILSELADALLDLIGIFITPYRSFVHIYP